ncbi:hypothetical protein PCA31118_05166 [Pandoraea captiosa]|uniref:Uncharacterized protein n=1 Tax=Pandoraea captiosa TaxID=2508302 RepID=A0A5E5AQY2_9BURK|nr:DUF2471 family protein [Pandoraea captiosa]VVE76231.1 hypothetical protein PCA31118_05166 [Pandoraea captiosa]
METIDWDQLALSAAERDLAGVVREIAARYSREAREAPHRAPEANGSLSAMPLDWRTLIAIADEAEADIGLHARHEPWVLARLLRLPGDEALRRGGELPSLDAPVDLQWPDVAAPAVFRAIVAAFANDTWSANDAGAYPEASMLASPSARTSMSSVSSMAPRSSGSSGSPTSPTSPNSPNSPASLTAGGPARAA